ncbi:MAG: XdhC/CoxI family protein [Elusimicrobiota bacterium]|jgi:xanthine dehydrogenase accessory factor
MKEEKDVVRLFAEAIESGASAAMLTVISAQGSTPREGGARMIVYPDGAWAGTVGGGTLESLCMKDALAALKEGKSRKAVYDLKPEGIGMLCMGEVEVYIDVNVCKLRLLILGAGHVGQKIAEVAAAAGIPCEAADERAEFASRERFPRAARVLVERPDKAVKTLKPDERSYVVIVTRGHELDQECLAAALKTQAAYIGMIGSRSKVPEIFRRLNRQGLHPEKDGRVHSPIGLDLGGKSPGEIAVSVVAQVLQLRYKRSARPLRIDSRP